MINMNRATLVGQFTADPEAKKTASGKAMVTFALATNHYWKKDDGEWEQATEFHKLVAWNTLAEHITNTYKKGDSVFIEGSLRTRKWESEGNQKTATEIVVRHALPIQRGKQSHVSTTETIEYTEVDVN